MCIPPPPPPPPSTSLTQVWSHGGLQVSTNSVNFTLIEPFMSFIKLKRSAEYKIAERKNKPTLHFNKWSLELD